MENSCVYGQNAKITGKDNVNIDIKVISRVSH
jgi:hypothetical protein